MNIKRQPTLLDRWLATPRLGSRIGQKSPDYAQMDATLRALATTKAKRFVLDDQATQYFGETMRDIPEAVAYAQEFAIPAFEYMWVELRSDILFTAVTGLPANKGNGLYDTHIAFFYASANVYCVVQEMSDTAYHPPALCPIYYRLNQPMTFEEELEFCRRYDCSRLGIDTFMWGKAADKFLSQRRAAAQAGLPHFDNDALKMLRANHGVGNLIDKKYDIGYKLLMDSCAGDLRNVIGLLLFLNRTSKTQYVQDTPSVRQTWRLQPRNFVSYSTISVKLNPVPAIRKLMEDAGANWRRRHDVRGHFCISKEAREAENNKCLGALHDWNEVGVNQWRCKTCDGLKWWRKAHQRGHIGKGLVQQDYSVTK